jgi:hypothetical protein
MHCEQLHCVIYRPFLSLASEVVVTQETLWGVVGEELQDVR